MIIAIAGVPGSGKTSVSRILAEHFGWPRYSIGDVRGKMAQERGLTLDELNALGEQESFTDKEVDEYQKRLGETEDHFIIEGRLTWHFIPHAFKILLTCDTHEAAERIYVSRQNPDDGREDEKMYSCIEETENMIKERMASDDRRYEKYYGLNYRDPSHYDLVIDTTNLPNAQATADIILKAIEAKT